MGKDMNITHDRKRISKFPHIILWPFMITSWLCLFRFKKNIES